MAPALKHCKAEAVVQLEAQILSERLKLTTKILVQVFQEETQRYLHWSLTSRCIDEGDGHLNSWQPSKI